jgi:hypothetical protein
VTRRRWVVAALAVAALLLLAALSLLGVVPGLQGRYPNPTPALASAYRAKDGCTCLFVLRRSPEACRTWTTASPDLASFEPDLAAGRVESRALLFWTARARHLGPGQGCGLE